MLSDASSFSQNTENTENTYSIYLEIFKLEVDFWILVSYTSPNGPHKPKGTGLHKIWPEKNAAED